MKKKIVQVNKKQGSDSVCFTNQIVIHAYYYIDQTVSNASSMNYSDVYTIASGILENNVNSCM